MRECVVQNIGRLQPDANGVFRNLVTGYGSESGAGKMDVRVLAEGRSGLFVNTAYSFCGKACFVFYVGYK